MVEAVWFLLLAGWVISGVSRGFDLAIRETVNGWAFVGLTRVMQAITTLGAGLVLWPLGAAIVWRLAATGRRRKAIWFAIVILSADLVSQLLKLVFHRVRPPVFFGLAPAETYSFPSGHAFVATVFYGAAVCVFLGPGASRRKRVLLAALVVAESILIGFSRVYLGYHYPSDVIGGWTLAALWLTLARSL